MKKGELLKRVQTSITENSKAKKLSAYYEQQKGTAEQRRSVIDAQVAEYMAKGGTVEELPGFEYCPNTRKVGWNMPSA